jgi:uncharacterized membrane protein
MMIRAKNILPILSLFGSVLLYSCNAHAQAGLTLYAPYTNISVPPGESIDYDVDVINNTDYRQTVTVYLSGVPEGWDYTLKSGGWSVKQVAVLPGEKKTLDVQVNVPLKVDKGSYRFNVVAREYDVLPLTVNVSEQGTYKSEFTCDQANMEGHSKSDFTFSAKLQNQTGEKQLYSLRANAPRGWQVTFKPDYKQATSVEIDPNSTKNINIEVKPPQFLGAGTYTLPVAAVTSSTSADLELEVVITGSYEMELTTPTGLLSTRITAGDEKRVDLLVKNTGSAELRDIEFSASRPANWEVAFEPEKVPSLKAGENATVTATIEASDKAIAGDYVATITAKTPEVSDKAAFRVSVRTPMLWGWVGFAIILVALGGVYYLFRKYGRR